MIIFLIACCGISLILLGTVVAILISDIVNERRLIKLMDSWFPDIEFSITIDPDGFYSSITFEEAEAIYITPGATSYVKY